MFDLDGLVAAVEATSPAPSYKEISSVADQVQERIKDLHPADIREEGNAQVAMALMMVGARMLVARAKEGYLIAPFEAASFIMAKFFMSCCQQVYREQISKAH